MGKVIEVSTDDPGLLEKLQHPIDWNDTACLLLYYTDYFESARYPRSATWLLPISAWVDDVDSENYADGPKCMLLFDQDAYPVVVLLKRDDYHSWDQVICQVLKDAARVQDHWPMPLLREGFEMALESDWPMLENLSAKAALSPGAREEFWKRAADRLWYSRVRIVVVSEYIPEYVERLLHYLDRHLAAGEQLDAAEIICLQVLQVFGDGRRFVVPRNELLRGGGRHDHGSDSQAWTVGLFFDVLRRSRGDYAVGRANALLQWAEKWALSLSMGKGKSNGSITPVLVHNGIKHKTITLWSSGELQFLLKDLAKHPPFDDDSKLEELVSKLEGVEGITIPKASHKKYPSIAFDRLVHKGSMERLLGVLDWALMQIMAATLKEER